MPRFVTRLVHPVILGDSAFVGACRTPGRECTIISIVFVIFAVFASVIAADFVFVGVFVDFVGFAGFVTVECVSRR